MRFTFDLTMKFFQIKWSIFDSTNVSAACGSKAFPFKCLLHTRAQFRMRVTTFRRRCSTFDMLFLVAAKHQPVIVAAPVAPKITTQPVNRTVTAGQTATFTVVAGGTAPLGY